MLICNNQNSYTSDNPGKQLNCVANNFITFITVVRDFYFISFTTTHAHFIQYAACDISKIK